MKKIFGAAALLAGVAAGFFAGKTYYQERYRKLSEQEIETMREYYRRKKAELKVSNGKVTADIATTKPVDEVLHTSTMVNGEHVVLTEDPPISKDIPYTTAPPSIVDVPPNFAKYWRNVNGYKSSTPEKPLPDEKPYVIRPEEVGDDTGYDVVNLTYYQDGELTDERDTIMSREDIEKAIGRGTLDQMGKYEPDILHVRNPKNKIDYEIQCDSRTYREVVGDKPYLLEE